MLGVVTGLLLAVLTAGCDDGSTPPGAGIRTGHGLGATPALRLEDFRQAQADVLDGSGGTYAAQLTIHGRPAMVSRATYDLDHHALDLTQVFPGPRNRHLTMSVVRVGESQYVRMPAAPELGRCWFDTPNLLGEALGRAVVAPADGHLVLLRRLSDVAVDGRGLRGRIPLRTVMPMLGGLVAVLPTPSPTSRVWARVSADGGDVTLAIGGADVRDALEDEGLAIRPRLRSMMRQVDVRLTVRPDADTAHVIRRPPEQQVLGIDDVRALDAQELSIEQVCPEA